MPATFSTAALVGNSPDFTETGAPGVQSTQVWVREVRYAMGDSPEHSAGLGGALDGKSRAVLRTGRKRVQVRVQS